MKTNLEVIWKSLLVGAAYAATLAITWLILAREIDAPFLFWSFVGGTVIGATLGLLASSMSGTWARHIVVWGSIIFLNIASVTIEGRFFAPDLVQGSMIVLIIQQLVVALVITWLIVKLFVDAEGLTPPTNNRRSWFSWL